MPTTQDKIHHSPKLMGRELERIDTYWRTANYLSVGQIYLLDNPLLNYLWLIHRLTYRRANHNNIHVRGCKEEGTTTTPFDMCVLNEIDRFHLVSDVIDRVPSLGYHAAYTKQWIWDQLMEHHAYIREHGDDVPSIRDWVWPF